jgi:exopolysaccharide production protein ExoZ
MLLNNLQALRAFAALSVVTFHFSLIPATGFPIHIGAFGVDLFFVLSGFIIAYSADRDPHHFLWHRAIRVLPPYWIATFVGLLFVLVSTRQVKYSLVWFAQSILFLPGPGGRGAIIFVAWTLVYELAFYVLYATSLWISRSFAPLICLSVLVFLTLGVNHLGLPLRPWPLVAEFAYGLVIFLAYKRFPVGKSRSPAGLGALLIGAGLTAFCLAGQLPDHTGPNGIDIDFRRVLVSGVPAAMIVTGLLQWERLGISMRNRLLLVLGSASYAMYLLHPLALGLLLQRPAGPFAVRMAWLTVATLGTVLCAIAYFYLVEAPVIRGLRRTLLGERLTTQSPQAVEARQ